MERGRLIAASFNYRELPSADPGASQLAMPGQRRAPRPQAAQWSTRDRQRQWPSLASSMKEAAN
jgi:hypothetical protein